MAGNTESPFGKSIGLGRLAGVPMRAHWSVLIIVALLTALLALSELPALRPGEPGIVYWSAAVGTAVLFFVSLCAHELAHALVARRFGIGVKRMTLWLFGGLTELDGEPESARADGWIAAAGPLTTLVFGAAFAGLTYLFGPHSLLGGAFLWLTAMSVFLALFNLLPAAPLDGGRLLRAIVWRVTGDRARGSRATATSGRMIGTLLMVFGLVETLAGYVGGLWLAFIGWFVVGASNSEQSGARAARLTGMTAGDVLARTPLVCPQWWTVAAVIDRLEPAAAAQPAFPVVDVDGQAIAALSLSDLERVPAGKAAEIRVDQLRPRRPRAPIVTEQTPLADVAKALQTGAVAAVVVDEAGRPLGVVDRRIIDRAARLATLGN